MTARGQMIDAARRRRRATTRSTCCAHRLSTDDDARASSPTTAAADVRVRPPGDRAGVRAPLILQTVLGFDAATIASAFLIAPATMGQRLVRAKPRSSRPASRSVCPTTTICRAPGQRARRDLRDLHRGLVRSGRTEARRRNSPTKGIWLGHLVQRADADEPRRSACSR